MSELCAVTVNENGLDVWKRKIDDFAINDAKETILFPSTLTKKNRKVLREYALSLGLEFKMNKIGKVASVFFFCILFITFLHFIQFSEKKKKKQT